MALGLGVPEYLDTLVIRNAVLISDNANVDYCQCGEQISLKWKRIQPREGYRDASVFFHAHPPIMTLVGNEELYYLVLIFQWADSANGKEKFSEEFL